MNDTLTIKAQPIEWSGANGKEWHESKYGFHITHDPSEPLESAYLAAWGEGPDDSFATLEEAQAWCQQVVDDWIRDHAVITGSIEPQFAWVSITDELPPCGEWVMAMSAITGKVMPLFVLERDDEEYVQLRQRFTAWHRITPAIGSTYLLDVLSEVTRATAKFPTWPTDPLHAVAVLGEEFGELTKAVLQSVYEPHKVSPGDVRSEAIQTAAMALRFLASLDQYDYIACAQHQQEPPR